jgi:hypothetical protein
MVIAMETTFDLTLQTNRALFVEWLAKAREQKELQLHEDITGKDHEWITAHPKGHGAGWLFWIGELYMLVDGRPSPSYREIGELMHLDIRDTGPDRVQVVCKLSDLTIAQAQGLITEDQRRSILQKVLPYATQVRDEIRRVFQVIEANGDVSTNSNVHIYVNGDLVAGNKVEATYAGGDLIGRDKTVSYTSSQSERDQAQRRKDILAKLRKKYIYSHDGIAPAMLAGLDPLPKEWVERELTEMGEAWRQDTYQ